MDRDSEIPRDRVSVFRSLFAVFRTEAGYEGSLRCSDGETDNLRSYLEGFECNRLWVLKKSVIGMFFWL